MNAISYWLITLHNKDDFMPGLNPAFGNTIVATEPTLKQDTAMATFVIKKTDVTYLNTADWSCDERPNELVFVSDCIRKYIKSEIKCSLPWESRNKSEPECNEKQIEK